jgi:hypothetical protein
MSTTMTITQLPADGARYQCGWGEWCKTDAVRAMDEGTVNEYMELMKRFVKIYPNTPLPTSVNRAMCDQHLITFQRELSRVEKLLEDKDQLAQQ